MIGAARADETKTGALADSIGKALPDWTVTDAQNAKKDVKLADFKGKWVLLEFWGFG
jgi:alkyl hydroperoxide reductase subunit AhpC